MLCPTIEELQMPATDAAKEETPAEPIDPTAAESR